MQLIFQVMLLALVETPQSADASVLKRYVTCTKNSFVFAEKNHGLDEVFWQLNHRIIVSWKYQIPRSRLLHFAFWLRMWRTWTAFRVDSAPLWLGRRRWGLVKLNFSWQPWVFRGWNIFRFLPTCNKVFWKDIGCFWIMSASADL